MPASIRLKVGTYTRCEFTAKETHCPLCGGKLRISQHAAHVFWTLKGRLGTISKEKRCLAADCPNPKLRYRPPEPRVMAISHSNLGLDLVFYIGEKRLSQGRTFRSLWRDMEARGIRVTQRTLQNAFHYYMSLFDRERNEEPKLRSRMQGNGGLVYALDAVRYEPKGPVLCVLLEVLTGEVLHAKRIDKITEKAMLDFYGTGKAYADGLDLPIWSVALGDLLWEIEALRKRCPDPRRLEPPRVKKAKKIVRSVKAHAKRAAKPLVSSTTS